MIAERIGLNAEYEEYAIHDTDNFPMEISEYTSIEELNRIYEQLEELPDYLLDDLDSFVSYYGSLEELVEHKDDIILYSGCETMTDLAYYLIDEEQALGEIPSSLQNYIDYEAYGRDLDIEGTFIAITLIVTVAFSISSMFYNISTDYPFFMVAFLQIICFAGIYMKLGELMSMFSLNANDSQQIGRRIFRRPMVFMRHRARRMERRIARAVGTGSMVGAGAGAVAGSAYNHSRSTHKNTPARPQRNNEVSMGNRVGSTVGAVMDTKNKVRDSASSLKENVKDLPTQAGYAVHSAKQKAKDNVSDFKRGVVEERENRQEQRRQKRNLHRENISQKKQELQKAQEARQTVHANGSATAGATRSHERPVATPVPKPAQTDTVTKSDMKRPATSPVIKNAEVKAGKETVRTNIRQEQQVKSVARANQPNVAESRSNRKKTTVQKQVNQKQNRKSVTKQPEKGRKK